MFRGRSTLIYCVLALGLLCYLTFIDKKIPGTREQETADSQLFKFDQDDVTGLEISTVKGAFTFQKKDGHWEVTSPVNTPADPAAVMEVIGQIAIAQPQRTIPLDGTDQSNESNLKDWGLSPAADRAVIHTKDKSFELLIGRKVAINASVYARTSQHRDAPVRVIPDTVKTALEKPLSDFRSRNVFNFDPGKVTRVATSVANTATTPAQECEVDLKDGNWTLQKPLVARAASDDVHALLDKIIALRVTDFVTDDPGNTAQYGLTSPTTTISVTAGDDEGVLQIGSPVPGKQDQVYAQRVKSNAILTLQQSVIDDIVKSLPNVRDRHVLAFDPGSVASVSFELTGAKPVKADLHRDKTGVWQVVGASAGTADVGKVTDLLTHLSGLLTTPTIKDSVPDLKPFGLDRPAGHITVTPAGGKPPLTLAIGKTENNLTYVRNSTEPFVYTLPAETFTFLGDNLFYRDRRAVNLIAAKVRSISITARGEAPLILDRSPGGTWYAENLKDRAVDATRTDAQASILCDLQAQTWLGAPKPAYGLDKPVLTFGIQADHPTPTVLKIGAPLPDGTHAAQVEGTPDVFAMSDADYGFLNASTLQLIPGAALNATNAAPSTDSSPEKTQAPVKKKKHKKSE